MLLYTPSILLITKGFFKRFYLVSLREKGREGEREGKNSNVQEIH